VFLPFIHAGGFHVASGHKALGNLTAVQLVLFQFLITFFHTQTFIKMKKLFLTLSFAAFGLLVMANPPKKNGKKGNFPYAPNQTLVHMYGEVENLRWTKSLDDLVRADFQIDGENFSTFFERDGKFVATTHEISLEQLPAIARKSLKAKMPGKDYTKIVHYQSNESATYFVEVAEQDGTAIYKLSSEGDISRFK
jgi:hypothetical protein